MPKNTFGYVWLSVYDEAGAAKRMDAIRGLDAAAFASYKASGGTTTLGVQPPIPPDGGGAVEISAAGPAVRIAFTEGSVENPDSHLFELSPVFASEAKANEWLEKHRAITRVGVANRVLLTISAPAAS